MQLVYYVFITNNRASYHLRWKKNLLKNQKVSKYYGNDCLHLLPFMSLLRAEIFKIRFGHKNIQIKMTYFISIDQVLPRVFQQILPSFNLQIFFLRWMGKRFHTWMILVDLKKAFDTLDHTVLLQKMESMGFNSQSLNGFNHISQTEIFLLH